MPPRSLRPRREGQSFASMFRVPSSEEELGDASSGSEDRGEGPSMRKKLPPIEDPITESEYDPGEEPVVAEEEISNGFGSDAMISNSEEGDMNLVDEDEDAMDLDTLGASAKSHSSHPRKPGGASRPSNARPQHESSIATFNFSQRRPGNRVAPSNPASNQNRNRAAPLFVYPGISQRLASAPLPFKPSEFVQTNGQRGGIATRVGRAWGSNIFPGPTWELFEDLSFFKEIELTPDGGRRRPIVHSKLSMLNTSFKILDFECVASNLYQHPLSIIT